MNKLVDMFFGPLNKDMCFYFMIIGFIALFFLGMTILGFLGYLLFNFKKINTIMVVNLLVISISYFLAYLVNRIMYTMCVKTL
jgi:hypothetical protein